MRLVEIITVRLGDPLSQALISEIEKALTDTGNGNHAPKIEILIDVETGRDLSVYMSTATAEKSPAGIALASYLSTRGIVYHTVWRRRSI